MHSWQIRQQPEVAREFRNLDLKSAAVIDEQGLLLGQITVDDVVDVITEQADHDILSMAGLDEEDDIFAPVPISAGRRAIWLGVNLATAFLAAAVVGMFEETLAKVVTLAVLMPVVASMGGIAGKSNLNADDSRNCIGPHRRFERALGAVQRSLGWRA